MIDLNLISISNVTSLLFSIHYMLAFFGYKTLNLHGNQNLFQSMVGYKCHDN